MISHLAKAFRKSKNGSMNSKITLPKAFYSPSLEISLIFRLPEKYQKQKHKITQRHTEPPTLLFQQRTASILRKCSKIWPNDAMPNKQSQERESVPNAEVRSWQFKDSPNQKNLQNQSVAEWFMLLHISFLFKSERQIGIARSCNCRRLWILVAVLYFGAVGFDVIEVCKVIFHRHYLLYVTGRNWVNWLLWSVFI